MEVLEVEKSRKLYFEKNKIKTIENSPEIRNYIL